MSSLRQLPKRLPFEPPPPGRPTTTETAGRIVAGVGVVAAAAVLPTFDGLGRVVGLFVDIEEPPFDQQAALAACGADATEPPVTDELNHVQCARCSEFVPYESMSLNEDGCFCAGCAASEVQRALAELPDEDYKL